MNIKQKTCRLTNILKILTTYCLIFKPKLNIFRYNRGYISTIQNYGVQAKNLIPIVISNAQSGKLLPNFAILHEIWRLVRDTAYLKAP